MIQWKQRLYAFLVRRLLGPFLDAASQEKLHESIQFSFQEGKFALSDVSLSETCLEKLNTKIQSQQQQNQSDDFKRNSTRTEDKKSTTAKNKVPTIRIVRIEKLQIHLSLVENSTNNSNHSTNSTNNSNDNENHDDDCNGVDGKDLDCTSEGKADDNSNDGNTTTTNTTSENTTSFAWKAFQLSSGSAKSSLALFAQVQITGVYVEVDPSSPVKSSTKAPSANSAASGFANSDTAASSGMLSSYVDAALSSLRLNLDISNLRVRVVSSSPSTVLKDKNTNNHFVEMRLSSASYHDVECIPQQNYSTSTGIDSSYSSSYKTILHKVIQFSCISIVTGSQHQQEQHLQTVSSAATIALIEGTGEVAFRVIEYTDAKNTTTADSESPTTNTDQTIEASKKQQQPPKQIQQDIEIKINQQVKLSVDETSLKQIQTVTNAFGKQDHRHYQQEEQLDEEKSVGCTRTNYGNLKTDDMPQRFGMAITQNLNFNHIQPNKTYHSDHNNDNHGGDGARAVNGIAEQYRLARQLAEQNVVRGGIIVPSNAYENGNNCDGDDDDDDEFDIFFDANEKSFYHYNSVLKESLMSSAEHEPGADYISGAICSPDFFHTKLRLHIVGGGIKVTFRDKTNSSNNNPAGGSTADASTSILLLPDEYVLLTFTDLNLTSSISSTTSDHTFTISHLEIDDSQHLLIPQGSSNKNKNTRRLVEIGNILRFSSAGADDHNNNGSGSYELLLRPPCISIHTIVQNRNNRLAVGEISTEFQVEFEPMELTYRHGTFSNLYRLHKTLTQSDEDYIHSQKRQQQHQEEHCQGVSEEKSFHFQWNCSSISCIFPVIDDGKNDYSLLYQRSAAKSDDNLSSLSAPSISLATTTNLSSLNVVFDNINMEYKIQRNVNSGTLGTNSDVVDAKFECHHILFFASSPAMTTTGNHLQRQAVGAGGLLRRRRIHHRMDIFTISGLVDVDPYIPVSFEYRQQKQQQKQQPKQNNDPFNRSYIYNNRNGGGAAENIQVGAKMPTEEMEKIQNSSHFPIFPTISSFKARQEDEEDDLEIDRVLAEKMPRDVGAADSRMGLRGQDPQEFMAKVASSGDSGSVLHIKIPEIYGDISKDEMFILNQMLQCVIPNPPTTIPNSPAPSPPGSPINVDPLPSKCSASELVSVALTCDKITLSIHNNLSTDTSSNSLSSSLSNCNAHNSCDDQFHPRQQKQQWVTYSLRMSRSKVHSVLQKNVRSNCTSLKQLRFCAHETSLFESSQITNLVQEENTTTEISSSVHDRIALLKRRSDAPCEKTATSAVPIFFRSKLFSAISRENPSILFDMINEEEPGNSDSVERKKMYLTFYNMTYRYDIDSQWLPRLLDIFQQPQQSSNDFDADTQQENKKNNSSSCEGTSFLRVFVSLADCNVDYSSSKHFNTSSRSIVRIGDFRISSNLIQPATRMQTFSLSLGDISIHLCPTRYPHNFENLHIFGSRLLMRPEDLSISPSSSLMQKNKSNAITPEMVFKEMNSRTILTLDSMDAIIAICNSNSSFLDEKAQRSSSHSSSPYRKKNIAPQPWITTSLTFGELSVYACKDSFKYFMGTISELQTKLTALNDQGLEELRAKSSATTVPPKKAIAGEETNRKPHLEKTENSTKFDSGSNKKISQLSPSSTVPVEDEFMLDGYDWTAIDHQMPASTTIIPPDEEQVARWYCSPANSFDNSSGSSTMPQEQHIAGIPTASFTSHGIPLDEEDIESTTHIATPIRKEKKPAAVRLITQHFPLEVVSNPFGDSDMAAADLAGVKSPPAVQNRILVHDLKIKMRLFDGYDWPEFLSLEKREASRNPKLLFVIDEQPKEEEGKRMEDEDSHGTATMTSINQNTSSQPKKSKLMDDLLAGPHDTLGGNDPVSTFQGCPLPEERGATLLEQSEIRRLSRRANRFLQISASGIRLKMDTYTECVEEHRLASCMDLTASDLFVAETIGNLNLVKMMGEWVNDSQHPRDTRDGFLMFKMVTWHPANRVTVDNSVANDEAEVLMTLLPMRCILDQRAVRFARLFFGSDEQDQPSGEDWAAKLHVIPPPIFRSFRTKPCKIKIDYMPRKLDLKAVKNGSIVELINLSPIDGMVITLQQVNITDIEGFDKVVGNLSGQWLQDICATQLYKFLTNSRPFEPLSRLSGGVADLFILPWDAYKNGDNVKRALRSGLSSLAGTVAYETLTTTSRITEYIALEMSKQASAAPTGSLPSRPLQIPKRVGDATGHALESLARGVQTANYKVVIVPYREYRKNGATGAVTSILKGIPIAIVAPMSGASEALSYTLLSARNQILPEVRKEEEANQRGLRFDGS